MKERILKIHASPYKAALAITGGGTEVIGELLRYGDGSNTLLEAIVPYANYSLDIFLGDVPKKYCSAETARKMASICYYRAMTLAMRRVGDYPAVGVGVTCSLTKAGTERAERQHFAYISTQTKTGIRSYDVELKLHRTREEEERLVADLIEVALAVECGVEVPLGYHVPPCDKLTEMTSIFLNHVAVSERKLIFPGSFNPPHQRHIAMAEAAFRITGNPVDFEISITNVDKPPLYDNKVVQERTGMLIAATSGISHIGKLHLTNAPTFVEKAAIFGPVTFIVGADTMLRIGNPKYCGDVEQVVEKLKSLDAKFLVFHRVGCNILNIPASLASICTFVSPQESLDDGVSSTKLRE